MTSGNLKHITFRQQKARPKPAILDSLCRSKYVLQPPQVRSPSCSLQPAKSMVQIKCKVNQYYLLALATKSLGVLELLHVYQIKYVNNSWTSIAKLLHEHLANVSLNCEKLKAHNYLWRLKVSILNEKREVKDEFSALCSWCFPTSPLN
jgi:hypothetical protein